DPKIIAAVQAAMKDKKLIIADGHHRYETALNYRYERRAVGGTNGPDAPYERVMMTFVNTEDAGLVILPTHRVVHGLKDLSTADFLKKVEAVFTVSEADNADPVRAMAKKESGTRVLAIARDGAYLLRARSEK